MVRRIPDGLVPALVLAPVLVLIQAAAPWPVSTVWSQEAAAPGADAPAAGPDMVSVPRLLANLDSDGVQVAASAARALGVVFSPGGRRGEEKQQATEALIGKLDSPLGAELRQEAARALGRMRAESAVEKLKTAMSDEDVDVAMAAGEAIGKILPVDEARAYLVEQGTDAEEQMLVAALHGLAPISKAEDAAFLKTGLASENWRAQEDAIRGLERAVRAGAELTSEDYDAIAAVLGNNILNAANQAVHFFTHIRNDQSFAAVVKAADTHGDGSDADETWRIRSQALRTLWHLGPTAQKKALPVIIRNLGDRTTNVSNQARKILYQLQKERYLDRAELFPLLLTELESAESLRTRGGIMREMRGTIDRQFASRVAEVAAKTLEESLEQGSEWPTRAYSLELLAASGYTGAMERVASCVGDDVGNVRQAAGSALEKLAPLCPPEEKVKVAPVLHPLLTNPVDWRKTAIAARAVGYYAGEAQVEPLTLLLSHSVLNARQGASHGLVTIVEQQENLRPAVQTALDSELPKNPRAWEFGAPVLGALGDTKALPQLTKMLQGGDWRTQVAAANAAAKLAMGNKINDEALSKALIQAGQSEVLQVQEATDRALRALTKM